VGFNFSHNPIEIFHKGGEKHVSDSHYGNISGGLLGDLNYLQYGGLISKIFFNFFIDSIEKFLFKAKFNRASVEFCSILCKQER
jgi:hypothetical protein